VRVAAEFSKAVASLWRNGDQLLPQIEKYFAPISSVQSFSLALLQQNGQERFSVDFSVARHRKVRNFDELRRDQMFRQFFGAANHKIFGFGVLVGNKNDDSVLKKDRATASI